MSGVEWRRREGGKCEILFLYTDLVEMKWEHSIILYVSLLTNWHTIYLAHLFEIEVEFLKKRKRKKEGEEEKKKEEKEGKRRFYLLFKREFF